MENMHGYVLIKMLKKIILWSFTFRKIMLSLHRQEKKSVEKSTNDRNVFALTQAVAT